MPLRGTQAEEKPSSSSSSSSSSSRCFQSRDGPTPQPPSCQEGGAASFEGECKERKEFELEFEWMGVRGSEPYNRGSSYSCRVLAARGEIWNACLLVRLQRDTTREEGASSYRGTGCGPRPLSPSGWRLSLP